MNTLKFAAILIVSAALPLLPAHVSAQETTAKSAVSAREAAKPASFGVLFKPKPEGVEVAAMLPDRSGAAIGMKVGDIVLQVDGKPINRDVFDAYMKNKKEGDELSFKVKRAGGVVDLTGKAVAARPRGQVPPPKPRG